MKLESRLKEIKEREIVMTKDFISHARQDLPMLLEMVEWCINSGPPLNVNDFNKLKEIMEKYEA